MDRGLVLSPRAGACVIVYLRPAGSASQRRSNDAFIGRRVAGKLYVRARTRVDGVLDALEKACSAHQIPHSYGAVIGNTRLYVPDLA